jgi:dolichol-phosphate hexosyltransferase
VTSMQCGRSDLAHTSAPSLTVIMPAHNEARTVGAAIEQVLGLDVGWPLELIVVDDGSTDSTPSIVGTFGDERLKFIRHAVNRGKGEAVRSGAALATGTHLAIYDADCEYRASDLIRMFEVIQAGQADIVYGNRNFDSSPTQGPLHYHLGRRLTTTATNVLFSARLSDLHTCLKMIPLKFFRSLELTEPGFGLDTEITAELLRRGHTLHEIPVSYVGRSRAEGKKITWRHGVECLKVLANVRWRGRPAIDLTLTSDPLGVPHPLPHPLPHSLPVAEANLAG